MMLRIWEILDWCFFGPLSNRGGPAALLIRILRYPYAVIRDLYRGDINLRAMGLVYTSLLSLVPLVAFSFAVLKVFGAHRGLQPIVYEFFRPVGARAASELTARVMLFADRMSSSVVGIVGLALLAWTSLSTLMRIEDSFNAVWRVEQSRGLARRIAEYLVLLIVGPLLLVGFIALSRATLTSAPMLAVEQVPLVALLVAFAPYAMVTAFFTGMYVFIPNTHVQWRAALIGALTAGVLWATVGRIFTAFVYYSTQLTLVYAGFAFFVAALLWTWLGWLILLAGTQLAFYIQNPTYLRLGLQHLRLSSNELEQLALRMMFLVGRAQRQDRRYSMDSLARELGLPALAVARMAAALERVGLLEVTNADELVCTRDPGEITVLQILETARNQSSGHLPLPELPLAPVDRLLGSLDADRRSRCANLTLQDLLGS